MRVLHLFASMIHIQFVVVILLFSGLTSADRLIAAEISTDEFLRAYKSAVLEQRKGDRALHIEGVLTQVTSGRQRREIKNKKIQTDTVKKEAVPPNAKGQLESNSMVITKIDYIRSSSEKLYHITKINSDEKDYVERVVIIAGQNRRYLLRRQSPKDDFYLENGDAKTGYEQWFSDFEKPVVDSPYSLGVVTIEHVIFSPTFRILELREIKTNGKKLYEVQFTNTYKITDAKSPMQSDYLGTLVVDPNNGYALTSYNVNIEIKRGTKPVRTLIEQLSGHIGYKDAEATVIPTPTEILSTQVVNGVKTEIKFKPVRWALEDLPPDTFSLSAYGLGELEKPAVIHSNRFSYWAITVAIAAFLGCAILYRLSRSPAPATQSS